MLGLTGLVMAYPSAGTPLLKGLIAACFGLLISSIGYARWSGTHPSCPDGRSIIAG